MNPYCLLKRHRYQASYIDPPRNYGIVYRCTGCQMEDPHDW